ncbi:hypothetical protein ABIE67_006874 [Streptomyces sp. V4I8]
MSHRCGAVPPQAVGVTAVAGGVGVTDAVEVTAVAGSVTRSASACPAISTKRVIPLRGYPVTGVTWRDPSPFT